MLEEFGIRLLTYDLPGFGESDPHPSRNLESSALDMSFFASSVGVNDKFWVLGYSSGGLHAWAALKYIPDRLAGTNVFFFFFYFKYISPYLLFSMHRYCVSSAWLESEAVSCMCNSWEMFLNCKTSVMSLVIIR